MMRRHGLSNGINRVAIGMGGGAPGDAIFLDSFVRADGAIGDDWIGATWGISTNKAINIPIGTALITNGGFLDWTSGIPTGWSQYSPSAGVREVTQVAPVEGHGGVGTGAANLYASAGTYGLRSPAFAAKTATWLKLLYTITNRVGGSLSGGVGNDIYDSDTGAKFRMFPGGVTYAQFLTNGVTDITIDDASLKEYSLAEISALRLAAQTDSKISVDVLYNERNWQGGLIVLDNPAAPLNGLLVYTKIPTTGTHYLVFDKILNGVRTNVANIDANYITQATDITLTLMKVGTDYIVRLKNSGVWKFGLATISDAAILACKYVGIFSPDPNIKFGNFSLYPSSIVHNTFWVGDSKLSTTYGDIPPYFTTATSVYEESPRRYAVVGATMASIKTNIDATLTAAVTTPELVFFNAGINDAGTIIGNEAAFMTNFQYILDAIHTKWPGAKVYAMSNVFATGETAEQITALGSSLGTVIANNPTFVYVWADENDWFAPNIATYSSDGKHYNAAGCAAAAQLGRLAAGFA